MTSYKPKQDIEILAARLFNDIMQNPGRYSEKQISEMTRKKLIKHYGDADDSPNKVTKEYLTGVDDLMQEIDEEFTELLAENGMDCELPKYVKAYLDNYVEGQEDAKRKASTTISDFMVHDVRDGLLFLGPSGSGKTYIWELLSKALDIPFVIKSMANATGSGFKGTNLTEGLEPLIGAEKGILFLDEIDKIGMGASGVGSGGFEEQLQNEVLSFFTGEIVKVESMSRFGGGPEPEKDQLGGAQDTAFVYSLESMRIPREGGVMELMQRQVINISTFFTKRGIPVAFRHYPDQFNEIPKEITDYLSEKAGTTPTNQNIASLFSVEYEGKIVNAPTDAKLRKAYFSGKDKEKKPKIKKKKRHVPPGFIDMQNILVVTAGAFHGNKSSPSLYRIIQRRLGGNTCNLDEITLLENLIDNDLIEYGFKPEFVGRLPRRAVLRDLGVPDFYNIIKSKDDSPVDKIVKQFEKIGITLHFDDPALLLLAEYANEGIGVRGVIKTLSEAIESLSYERDEHIGKIINFTRSDLSKRLEKEVRFKKVDDYVVDWFDIKSILGYLDLFVPNQEIAKRKIAKAFHLYHVKMSNPDRDIPLANILGIGPSGCGKSYMIEGLARKAELPIASTKATGKVPMGFGRGEQLSEVFEQFAENQKYGIVYIDEADEILLDRRNGLNEELIGFLERGEVSGRKTDNFLFIFAGAFQELYKKHGDVTRDILMEAGIRDELLGRLPIIVNYHPPTVETMLEVLNGPDSELDRQRNYFQSRGLDIDIEKDVYTLIAQEALKLNIGFRGLKTVCDDLFEKYIIDPNQYVKNDTVLVRKKDILERDIAAI